MNTTDFMDTDFIESEGRFSINPQQVTNIEYFENALYFYFSGSEYASMRLKFVNEECARQTLEGFKMAVARKVLED